MQALRHSIVEICILHAAGFMQGLKHIVRRNASEEA